MKKPFIFLCGVMLFCSARISRADLVSYEFSGSGDRMFEHDGQTGTNTTVNTSTLMGFSLSNNAVFSGVFTYDTSAVESTFRQNYPDKNTAIYSYGVVDFEVNIGSLSYPFSHPGSIQIWDNRSSSDRFGVSASETFSGDMFVSASFAISDSTMQSITGFSIPSSLEQISSEGRESFHIAWVDKNNGDQLQFSGYATQLEPVPVPSALMLGILGLGVAGRKLRRRSAA